MTCRFIPTTLQPAVHQGNAVHPLPRPDMPDIPDKGGAELNTVTAPASKDDEQKALAP